jgi:hypothetical protein
VPDYEEGKNLPNSRARALDVPIVLLSTVALILVGPLQQAVGAYPLVPFASTLFLFMVPGVLLGHWFLGERFWGAALVPDAENTCIPAYSARANVVTLRGGLILNVLPALERRADGRISVPQGALDVHTFFSSPTSEEVVRILRSHEMDYVMVPTKKSHLNERLGRLPGFVAIATPGRGYDLYMVDRRKLDQYLDQT